MASRVRRLLPVCVALASLLYTGQALGGQLTISWADNSNGTARTVLQRRPGTSSVYTTVAILASGVTAYVDTSLTSGAAYCYRAFAVIDHTVSGYSNDACAIATDPVPKLSITVGKVGTGTGTVTSAPAGINCGSVCSMPLPAGTYVSLTATAGRGSTFAGWSGSGCSGTASCVLAGNASLTVSASFTRTLPSLTVTPTTAPTGTTFIVSLANWSGSASDWVAIAPAGAPNTTYGAWAYVPYLPSAGGTRTWRVTLTTPGTFEARLFLNGGFTRGATSTTLSVASVTLTPTVSSSTLSVASGNVGTEFSVTLTNWSGGYDDWLTIVPAGVANTVYGPWVYVGSLAGTGGSKTWRVTLSAQGTFEVRLFLNSSYTRAATSPTFTVPAQGIAVVAP